MMRSCHVRNCAAGLACAQHMRSELLLAAGTEGKHHCADLHIKAVTAFLAFLAFESDLGQKNVCRFEDEDSSEKYECVPAD